MNKEKYQKKKKIEIWELSSKGTGYMKDVCVWVCKHMIVGRNAEVKYYIKFNVLVFTGK